MRLSSLNVALTPTGNTFVLTEPPSGENWDDPHVIQLALKRDVSQRKMKPLCKISDEHRKNGALHVTGVSPLLDN